MADKLIKPQELIDRIDYQPPQTDWMDTPVDIRNILRLIQGKGV